MGHHDADCTAQLFIDAQHGWIADWEEVAYPTFGAYVWRTEDGGAHWQRVGLP